MKGRGIRQAKLQGGVAMVEFAVALPLLLLLLLAVAEFGRMLYHYNSLMQASRDASRFVAGQAWNRTLGKIVLESDEDLKSKTKNIAVYGAPVSSGTPVVPGLTTDHVSVEQVDTEHVQVRISYEFQSVIGDGIPAFIGSEVSLSIPLVATTVMRAL
jgi:Flp pilus assembly protein TadG